MPNNKLEYALHYAVLAESVEYVRELINNGAEINCRDQDGNTPLHKAIENTHPCNIHIIRMLLENEAEPNFENNDGKSVLYMVIPSYFDKELPNLVDIFKLLIRYGADVNFKLKKDGTSILHKTVSMKDFAGNSGAIYLDILTVLLSGNINLNAQDQQNRTALHEAIIKDRVEVAKILIFRGIDVNLGDPLSLAEKLHHDDIVNLLKQHGAKKQGVLDACKRLLISPISLISSFVSEPSAKSISND